MSAQDKFIFILTFMTGFAVGFYVYVVSFKPTYAPESIDRTEELASDFSVIGKQYGNNERGYIAPSFRVTGEGQYSYIAGGLAESALEPTEGQLPRQLTNNLKIQATPEELSFLSQKRAPADCRSANNGVDYIYRLIIDGVEYELDSCQTLLSYDTDLAKTLEELWQYLEDPQASSNSTGSLVPLGDSLQETGVNFIREHLSPYED
jgi:hypothetical protein